MIARAGLIWAAIVVTACHRSPPVPAVADAADASPAPEGSSQPKPAVAPLYAVLVPMLIIRFRKATTATIPIAATGT